MLGQLSTCFKEISIQQVRENGILVPIAKKVLYNEVEKIMPRHTNLKPMCQCIVFES